MIIELKNINKNFLEQLQAEFRVVIPEKIVIDCSSEMQETLAAFPLGMFVMQYFNQSGSEIEKQNMNKAIFKRKL